MLMLMTIQISPLIHLRTNSISDYAVCTLRRVEMGAVENLTCPECVKWINGGILSTANP